MPRSKTPYHTGKSGAPTTAGARLSKGSMITRASGNNTFTVLLPACILRPPAAHGIERRTDDFRRVHENHWSVQDPARSPTYGTGSAIGLGDTSLASTKGGQGTGGVVLRRRVWWVSPTLRTQPRINPRGSSRRGGPPREVISSITRLRASNRSQHRAGDPGARIFSASASSRRASAFPSDTSCADTPAGPRHRAPRSVRADAHGSDPIQPVTGDAATLATP